MADAVLRSSYAKAINSHDLLKGIALFAMFIDHIGFYCTLPENLFLRVIGRSIAPPLFFFINGYQGTVRLPYLLAVCGLILSCTHFLLFHQFFVNILFSFIINAFLLRHFLIVLFSPLQKMAIFIFLMLLHPILSPYLEHGTLGLLFAYAGQLHSKRSGSAWLMLTSVFYLGWDSVAFNLLRHQTLFCLHATLSIGVFFILHTYFIKPLKYQDFSKKIGMGFTRYSLWIYFFSTLCFQILFYIRIKK